MKRIAAIAGITILAGLALYLGHNGVLLLTAIGIIAGLGGEAVVEDVVYAFGNIGEALKEVQRKKFGGRP